jgi:hypothetical protein
MDMFIGEEMNAVCERYDGFCRFAKLLERLAEGTPRWQYFHA